MNCYTRKQGFSQNLGAFGEGVRFEKANRNALRKRERFIIFANRQRPVTLSLPRERKCPKSALSLAFLPQAARCSLLWRELLLFAKNVVSRTRLAVLCAFIKGTDRNRVVSASSWRIESEVGFLRGACTSCVRSYCCMILHFADSE